MVKVIWFMNIRTLYILSEICLFFGT